MKPRFVILVSLFLPALFFLTFRFGGVFYRPELRGLNGDWTETDFETYADDASLLRGTVSRLGPDRKPRGLVLLLAGNSLDRDWTHRGSGFAAGRILARRLAGMGFQTIRFDQRGTGKTRQSGRNYAAPKNQARDARRVLEHLEKSGAAADASDLPFFVLAQGDGCGVALRLLNDARRRVESVLFTGCVLHGNLLDQWLGRILTNMQRVGVAPEILSKARARVAGWRASRPWASSPEAETGKSPAAKDTAAPDFTEEQHPDLQALDRALEQMTAERLIDFTRQADEFNVQREFESLMAEQNPRVVHLLGEHDLVTPARDIEAARAAAKSLASRYPDRYRFRVLPETDHFLARRESRTAGSLFIVLENLNPFRRVSPAFLAELDAAAALIEEGGAGPGPGP